MTKIIVFFLPVARQPLVGKYHCYRVLTNTLDMSWPGGLLWMSDGPEAETSTDSTQQSQETIHAASNMRT
jgi:hypothetical protein